MTSDLILNRLCVHFVNKKQGKLDTSPVEQDISKLDPFVCDFLINLIEKVWNAEERGSTISARFSNSGSSTQLAEQQIKLIRSDENQIHTASEKLAQHLFNRSAANASPGLLGVLRLIQPKNGCVYVVILKIEIDSQKFVRLSPTTLTQLSVEDVENMLLKDIQKGAIHPHPTKTTYDLKVVENQSDTPAKYFSEGFLGCRTKKADEHQIKKLLPELERYAQKSGLPFAKEKALDLIITLQDRPKDVDTAWLTWLVEEKQIYGPEYDKNDFYDYFEKGNDPGPIDIPHLNFINRGKGVAGKTREFKIEFTDPQIRFLKIAGPAHTLKKIMQVEGDTVTFTIRTTKDGFDVKYE